MVSRRNFLRACATMAGAGACATLLQACGASPAAAPAAPSSTSASASAGSAAKPSAAAVASSAAPSPSVSAAASGLRKVRYGSTGAGFNPFIAMDQGYFAEQGIEVELVRFDSAANMIAPLGAGQIDTGSGAIGAGLWNAVARGVVIRVVADGGHSDATPPGFPQQELLVRKSLYDSGKVKSVADLRGLTLGMSVRGTSVEYAIVKMLEKGGLTMMDVNPVEMPPTEFAVAMSNGKVDAAAAIQPSVTTLLTEGLGAHLMYDWEAVPNNQSLALIFSPQFATSDLALPFMTGYLKGLRVYDDAFLKKLPDARTKAFDAVVKYGPVKDRSVYEKQTSFFLVDPDGKLRLQSLNDQQDFFLSTGTQTTRLDFSKVVDTSFAEQAAAKLGPYKLAA
ncbi:MAG TPA: ABC transporter substrate-binding protein [Chloroflexota bacterium]|nr:ABC transporter substrate-binding protein [Chloroflexota bacterium]